MWKLHIENFKKSEGFLKNSVNKHSVWIQKVFNFLLSFPYIPLYKDKKDAGTD